MARERPCHVHAGQDLLPREPGPLPEGDHAVRVHRIPAVEEDDLVTFHDRAHAEEGRQVEHEVGAAVDQGDLARVEGPEDPVQGGRRAGGAPGGPGGRGRGGGGGGGGGAGGGRGAGWGGGWPWRWSAAGGDRRRAPPPRLRAGAGRGVGGRSWVWLCVSRRAA